MFRLLLRHTKDGWWAAILGPLFVIIEVIFDAAIPYVMSLIIDEGINARGGDIDYIVKMGELMVLLAVGAAILGALSGLFASLASGRFVRNIRMDMYKNMQTYGFKNIEKFPVSTIVTRLTTDMRQLRMAYTSIVRMMVRSPINLVVSALMIYRLHPDMAMIIIFMLPILGGGLAYIMINAHPRFVRLMHLYDGMNSNLKENIEGIRVVKTFVREENEINKFADTSTTVTKGQRFAENLVILNGPFFQLITYICMILIAWYGGNYVISGSMTTGQFMSFLSYIRAILFSLLALSQAMMQIVFANASVARANQILDEKTDIDDTDADASLEIADGSIEFRNVSFKYNEEASKNTLSNINLKIESGEVIGILGPTGSSKTSLVQLIPRLYETTEGEVLVGGRNVKEYKLHTLRDAVSMVLQKNVLFSGTIEENMRWGNPNATHEEVVQACKYAQADDFITSFPDGYNTQLGQGGSNVSGGQKQRLCIARALLKNPKIIILDDSTSAVDTDTDHRIQLALKEKLGNMTTIIIAQRVSSIQEANRIIIMNEGSIADIGTHEELLARNEVYRDLYETQMKGVSE